MENLAEIKKHFIERVNEKLINHTWDIIEVVFQFPPTTGKACEAFHISIPTGTKLSFIFDFYFVNEFYDYIEMMMNNGNEKVNQILFKMEKGKPEEAFIEASFNQKIVDDFENTLPKSKRGKIKPWWQK